MEYVSQVGIVYGVSLRACVARIWLYGAGAPGPDPQGTETSNSAVRVVNDLFKVPEPVSSYFSGRDEDSSKASFETGA